MNWVFPVDQMDGMHDVTKCEIEPLPVTFMNVEPTSTQSPFHCGEKTVAIIEEAALCGALARRVA